MQAYREIKTTYRLYLEFHFLFAFLCIRVTIFKNYFLFFLLHFFNNFIIIIISLCMFLFLVINYRFTHFWSSADPVSFISGPNSIQLNEVFFSWYSFGRENELLDFMQNMNKDQRGWRIFTCVCEGHLKRTFSKTKIGWFYYSSKKLVGYCSRLDVHGTIIVKIIWTSAFQDR